jgi:uncharacterized membrane protein
MAKPRRNPNVPAKNGKGGVMAGVEVREEFSGPIPPPTLLDGYEKILPGAAERILVLAEDEAKHRRSVEILTRKAEIRLAKGEHYQVYLGQFFALIVTLAFVSGAVFLIYNGKAVTGTILAGGAVAGIAAAFLRRPHPKK